MSSVPPQPLEDQTQASDATDTDQALELQDELFVQSDTHARHCPWLVYEPLGLWRAVYICSQEYLVNFGRLVAC
jgi:hypothetical protein